MTNLLFIKATSDYFIYSVEENNFFALCRKFGVSPSRVIRLNGLTQHPQQNDLLVLPRKTGVLHSVGAFESLEEISRFYNCKKEEILAYNFINGIFAGQIIEIPR